MCTNKRASANSRSCTRAARSFYRLYHILSIRRTIYIGIKKTLTPYPERQGLFVKPTIPHTPDSYKGSTSVSKTEN